MRSLKRRLFTFLGGVWLVAPASLGVEPAQAAIAARPVPPSAATRTPLVFTHVTVIDVGASDARRALKLDQTVVISGEHVAAVGKTGTVRIPAGAQVIDATGKFMMPGLWDMHVHMNEWNTSAALNLFLAIGVTGVRDMGADFQPILRLRQQIASGSRLGPRMVVAGPSIYGVVTSGDARRYITPDEARAEVRRRKQAGVDFIKVYSYLSVDAFFAVMDEAKKQGLVVAGHVPFAVKPSDAAKAGLRSIEHLEGATLGSTDLEHALQEEIRLRILDRSRGIRAAQIATDQTERYRASFNARKLQELAAVYRQYGTWQCPTMVVPEVAARQPDLLRAGPLDPRYFRYVSRRVQEAETRELSTMLSPEQAEKLKLHAAYKRVLAAALHRAGVKFLACTDAPVFGQIPGFSLHDELAIYVDIGFSPLQALQTATINPARFLGREKELGTVAPRKLADLVLLDANPLDDIANTRRINAVVVNGMYLPKERLQAMLADVEAAAARKSLAETIFTKIEESGIRSALEQYGDLRENHSDSYDLDERAMNEVGYRLLRSKKTREAIEVFKLNVEAFPESSNVYDSLGEAYAANGDIQLAIRNYQRSVELDPQNTHGIEMLRKLRAN